MTSGGASLSVMVTVALDGEPIVRLPPPLTMVRMTFRLAHMWCCRRANRSTFTGTVAVAELGWNVALLVMN